MTKLELKQKILKVLKVFNGREEAIFDTCWKEIADLEKENAELKAKNKWYSEQVCNKECAEVWGKLTKAKEHIRTLISCLIDWVQEGDKDYCYIADAEQFLKEIEK